MYMFVYTIMLIGMSMCLCVRVPVYGDWMDFEALASLNVEHLVRFNVKAVGPKIIKYINRLNKQEIKNKTKRLNRFCVLILLTTNHSDRTVIDRDSTLDGKAMKSCKVFTKNH